MGDPPKEPPPEQSEEPPKKQPEEHLIHRLFRFYLPVLSLFGLGIALASKYPYVGLGLLLLDLAYVAFDFYTSPRVTKKLSRKPRIVLVVVICAAFISILWSSRRKIFSGSFPDKEETWNKLIAKTTLEPSDGTVPPIFNTLFTITNYGRPVIGEDFIACQVKAISLIGNDMAGPFSNVIVFHGMGLNGGGDAETVKCFDIVKHERGTSILGVTCADVVLQIRYVLAGDKEWASKTFRYVASGHPENRLSWHSVPSDRRSDYCGPEGAFEPEFN